MPRTDTGNLLPAEEHALRRLLLTFVLKFPTIGYCQSMNFIALALLRAMESEEMAFWTLGGLATTVLPGYYTASMSGTQIDMKIMADLVDQHVPAVAAHLAALECPLELMLSQWLLPIYITTFPPACTMLIWDWLFVAGSDTLLMVATAFLSLYQEEICQQNDFADIATYFQEQPPTIYKPEALLSLARTLYDKIGVQVGAVTTRSFA